MTSTSSNTTFTSTSTSTLTLTPSSSSSSSSSSHSIPISKSHSPSNSNHHHHFQSHSNHTSNGSSQGVIDSLHGSTNQIINTLQKDDINYQSIQLCNLSNDDQAGLGHALQEAIRQQTCSIQSRTMLSTATQDTGSQYAIDQTLDRLTGSDESTLFEHSETVKALEQILHSQLFEMVPPQPTQEHTNSHHPLQSDDTHSSLIDKSINHDHSKTDSQILNNEDFFKAAAACLQHEDDQEAMGASHHKTSEDSNLDHHMETPNSLQAVSNVSVDLFIDPRLHNDLSVSDEMMQVDSFRAPKQTFNSSEFTSHHQLGLRFGMRMNDRSSHMSNQSEGRRVSTEALPFGLDLSSGFNVSDLPAELEMLLSQDIQSNNCPNQTVFPSPALRRNEPSETTVVNPLKRPKARSDASRTWMRRPSSSISALLIQTNDMSTPCKSRTRASASPKSAQSIPTAPDPNVHPLLQGLEFEEAEDLYPMKSSSIRSNRSTRKRARSSSDDENQCESSPSDESEDNESDTSTPKSLKINHFVDQEKEENVLSSSLNGLSERGIDVHGSGAGGGAAAILESIYLSTSSSTTRKMKNRLPLTSSTFSIYIKSSLTKKCERLEREEEEPPERYHPDQFRSFNRIHWTKEEEELLLSEVEMNYQRYDCMSQIMKRHGPNGTVSKTFSDRTGVSLKDKAVNISSRWYRDGTEVSDLRRRAFARFRPKQLRGKLRSELPGMKLLMESSSFELDHDHNENDSNENEVKLDEVGSS